MPQIPWEAVADTMIDLILFLDPEGALSRSPAAGRLHRHQVLNRWVFEFVPQDSQEPLRQAMATVHETGAWQRWKCGSRGGMGNLPGS